MVTSMRVDDMPCTGHDDGSESLLLDDEKQVFEIRVPSSPSKHCQHNFIFFHVHKLLKSTVIHKQGFCCGENHGSCVSLLF